jgi:hypothetical protein
MGYDQILGAERTVSPVRDPLLYEGKRKMVVQDPSLSSISQLHDGPSSVHRPAVDHTVGLDETLFQIPLFVPFRLHVVDHACESGNSFAVQIHLLEGDVAVLLGR